MSSKCSGSSSSKFGITDCHLCVGWSPQTAKAEECPNMTLVVERQVGHV